MSTSSSLIIICVDVDVIYPKIGDVSLNYIDIRSLYTLKATTNK